MTENRWINDLHWRREGRQIRSEKTQSALLDAAEELILQRGTKKTSVADIARKADVSIGSLYHHFKDKTALYYAVFHRMTSTFEEMGKAGIDPTRWEGANVEDVLRGFISLSLRAGQEARHFKAAAMLIAEDYPQLREHYAEIQAEIMRGLHALVLHHRSEIGHPDPEAGVAFILDQLNAMIRSRMDDVQKATQIMPVSDEVFVEEAVRSACGYLVLKRAG